MTDRGESALRQTKDSFTVGPSSLNWRDGKLIIDVNEISAPPVISRVAGRITITPSAITNVEMPLHPNGTHIWRPFAPTAKIDVELNKGLNWTGHGYFDANFGTRALEDDFSYWTWGRFPLSDGSACFYDANRRDGTHLATGLSFGVDGSARVIDPPPLTRFNRSIWGVKRETRSDPDYKPRQVKMMLEAPFYSRAAIATKINGEETVGVYEALDLNRFASPLLKPMLAVRVPRRPRWRFDDA